MNSGNIVFFQTSEGFDAQGEVLHWGTKVVRTPSNDWIPTTVVYVKELNNGKISAFEPESLVYDVGQEIVFGTPENEEYGGLE